jgi:hypothetical protein
MHISSFNAVAYWQQIMKKHLNPSWPDHTLFIYVKSMVYAGLIFAGIDRPVAELYEDVIFKSLFSIACPPDVSSVHTLRNRRRQMSTWTKIPRHPTDREQREARWICHGDTRRLRRPIACH